MRRFALLAATALVVGFVLLVATTRGPSPPGTTPPGSFAFAALGDSPYYFFEEMQYRVVLEDLAAHDLAAVVHVGDLFWETCTDERYRRSRAEFDGLPHPVVYTPGDNEWADCWEHSGDLAPLGRLEAIREIFYADPARSLGGRRISLAHQGADETFGSFVENARWTHEGVVFATVHLVGSGNAMGRFPGRAEADDSASTRRTRAAAAWLQETFDEARAADAAAVVLAFHANLFDEAGSGRLEVFEPFLATLEEEVFEYGRPVLAVHGDWHEYTVDHPLTRRSTDRPLDNLTRLQVPGSYDVGWVRVTVTPDAAEPFAFEPRVVPGWKYW